MVKRILVVGRDAAAWVSALALRRALGDGVSVTVLELPSLLLESDVYAAVPAIAGLHEPMGIAEGPLSAVCKGVPMLAQRFSNWSRSATGFLHGYDAGETAGEDVPFIHYWLKARREGLRVEYEDFSLAAAAAKQARVPPEEARLDPTQPRPGYQYDARRYAALLKQLALRSGVEHRTGRVAEIHRDQDRIVSMDWDSGESFDADLYVDASGAEAVLIRGMPGAEFESWREWLPCDRILSASAPPLSPLPAFSQVSAFRGGWVGLHPLQNRTAVIAAFSSEFADVEMLRNLPVLAGVAVEGDAVVTPFEPGMRPRPWIGNCVAIGAAAIDLEPLDAVVLHILHLGVTQLLSRLSNGGKSAPDVESYNRSMAAYATNIRDLQIAHYRLNRRFDEPLWDRAREAVGPATLDTKLTVFRSSGTVPLYDRESFQAANWAAVSIGHGLIPEAYDSRLDQVPQEQQMVTVQRRLRAIADAVNAMPTVEQFLRGAEQSAAAAEV